MIEYFVSILTHIEWSSIVSEIIVTIIVAIGGICFYKFKMKNPVGIMEVKASVLREHSTVSNTIVEKIKDERLPAGFCFYKGCILNTFCRIEQMDRFLYQSIPW